MKVVNKINRIEDLISEVIKLLDEESDLDLADSLCSLFRALDYIHSELNDKLLKLVDNLKELEKIPESAKVKSISSDLMEYFNRFNEKIRNILNIFYLNSDPFSVVKSQSNNLIGLIDESLSILIDDCENTMNKLKSLLNRIKSYSKFDEVSNALRSLEDVNIECQRISNCLDVLRDESKKLLQSKVLSSHERAIYIAKFLKELVWSGIWVHELISQLTGLRSISGELQTQEVSFRITGKPVEVDEDRNRLPLDVLFMRYPPFEPIHDEVNGIIGSNVWFIASKNVRFTGAPFTDRNKVVIRGNAEEQVHSVRLIEVETINLMHNDQLNEIYLEIILEDDKTNVAARPRGVRNLWIKYGSKKLFNRLRSWQAKRKADITQIVQEIQKEYAEQMSKLKRRAYRVNDLGYVWYCYRGYAMSTDPYDFRCPFMRDCYVGSFLQKRGSGQCPNWSRSRRLFPKVYVESKREVLGRGLKHEKANGMFTPVVGNGIRIIEYIVGAQWFMPTVVSLGNLVRVKFEKPIVKELYSTNAIGFSLPLSLVKAILSELIDESVTPKPRVKLVVGEKERSITLDKLLLSKFMYYYLTGKGHYQLRILQLKKKKLAKKISEFYQKIKQDESLIEKFINYLLEVLGHTLAHLFYSYISNSLEIEPANLSYLSFIDGENDELVIIVFENSPYGVIDLPDHALSYFGSYQQMIESFMSFMERSLNQHEQEVIEYKKRTLTEISKRLDGSTKLLRMVAEELQEKWYNYLVDQNIVMDVPTFTYYLVLSNALKDVLTSLSITNDTKLQRHLDTIVRDYMSIIHCIDGCTMCVVLDEGCISPLTQNLETSRNLVMWVLKALSGQETIYGRGWKLIDPLFRIARREIVVLSPYVDDEGIKALKKVVERGIQVTLLTREENIKRYENLLRQAGVNLYPIRERHDKLIIIDDEIVVETSQNLSGLHSINNFKIIRNPEKAQSLKMQLLHVENVTKT
ncbi:MAG: phospholipase D-like domain-containing protein [Desulfurococcaceae archaeon]